MDYNWFSSLRKYNYNYEFKPNTNDQNIVKPMNRLDNLQSKILKFINVKLDLKLTGNEIKLELNNKNICNIDLNLLSGVNFNNLEELDLSHNNITDLECLKDFNFKKIKKIDLSFNKINNFNTIIKFFY